MPGFPQGKLLVGKANTPQHDNTTNDTTYSMWVKNYQMIPKTASFCLYHCICLPCFLLYFFLIFSIFLVGSFTRLRRCHLFGMEIGLVGKFSDFCREGYVAAVNNTDRRLQLSWKCWSIFVLDWIFHHFLKCGMGQNMSFLHMDYFINFMQRQTFLDKTSVGWLAAATCKR